MKEIKDIEWFRREIGSTLSGYELNYKFFKEGDFGSLNQIEFNSKRIGGNIDFWSLGWLGIFVWNYEAEQQILNVLLEPNQNEEKEKIIEKLKEILKLN